MLKVGDFVEHVVYVSIARGAVRAGGLVVEVGKKRDYGQRIAGIYSSFSNKILYRYEEELILKCAIDEREEP